ncbi:four helix bundle protein [Lunatimonas salinarum]|uniref:four helix bundle protein n=1 Tax=Lunatimonas salinarum TaxID=1774590 RepID=UPI001ADF2485|nr:four helix bundle protein [Lunatimonas salinarum]
MVEEREFVISKQFLRAGTSEVAKVRKQKKSETKNGLVYKMAIAQKEINERTYWVEKLKATTKANPKQRAAELPAKFTLRRFSRTARSGNIGSQ